MNEIKYAKKDKFKKLSENRVNQILDKIRVLSNLANKSNYEYDDKDVNKMFLAIERALKEAKNRFQSNNKKENYKFKW